MPRDEIQQAILQEFGLEQLPVDKQQEALATIGLPIFQAVTLAIMQKLPEDAQAQFQQTLTGGDGEKVAEIINAHIPDSTAFMEAAVRKAIDEFKSFMPAQ